MKRHRPSPSRCVDGASECVPFERPSLAGVTSNASLLSRARACAVEAAAKSAAAEASTREALSLLAQIVAENHSARCTALSEALAPVSRAREDAAAAVAMCARAEASSVEASALLARIDGEGTSGAESEVLVCLPPETRAIGIMSLPDCVIENIFVFLDGYECQSGSPTFPLTSELQCFAFSCYRFAKILRGSYIKEYHILSCLQFARNERIYFQSLSGALERFTAVEKLVITGTGCVDDSFLAEKSYWRQAPYDLRPSIPAIDYSLAVKARNPLAATAARGCSGLSRLKKITFEPGNSFVHAQNLTRSGLNFGSVWNWGAESERWLDYLPSVTSVEFKDLGTACRASLICGSAVANLKELVLWLSGNNYYELLGASQKPPGVIDVPKDDTLVCEPAQFCNLEKLVLQEVGLRESFRDLQMPTLVEALPMLREIFVVFGFVDDYDIPFLQCLVRDPKKPPSNHLKLTISSPSWKNQFRDVYLKRWEAVMPLSSFDRSSCVEKDTFCVDQFKKAIVGDFSSHWDANLVPGTFELHTNSPFGVTVEVTFRSAPQ